VRVAYPVQANGVFTDMSRDLASRLLQDWPAQVWSEAPDGRRMVLRWMTAFDSAEEDVAELAAAIGEAAARTAAAAAAVPSG